jgi:hypothetical protein
MSRSVLRCVFVVSLFVLLLGTVRAQESDDRRVTELEARIRALEHRVAHLPAPIVRHGPEGAALFLYGCFCALWAQNTNRNPWLWFFMGILFSVITALVLLAKNAEDRRGQRLMKEKTDFGPWD